MTGSSLRVLLVAETALPYVSGVTVATDALARGLGALGHEVLLMGPRPPRGSHAPDAGTGGPAPRTAWLPSVQLPPPAPRGYRVPLPLAGRVAMRTARDFAPDIVHVQSPFGAGRRGARLARLLDVPLVFTHHTRFSDYTHYLGPAARPSAAALRRTVAGFWERCDAVIAPGADLGAEILAGLPRDARTWSASSRPESTWPQSAPSRRWTCEPPPGGPRTRRWPHPGPPRRGEEPRRGLEMAALVRGLHLAAIGGGALAATLRRRAARPDLAGRTWFAGAQPRPTAIGMLRGANLFVVASRTETQGLVVAEALAAGLPVVAIDAPGVRDAVRTGTDGLLVAATPASTRPARMAEVVAGLLVDRPRLSAMAEAAGRDADRLGLETRTREVIGLYRELLARRTA